MRKSSTLCPRWRDVPQRRRCDNAIVWSVGAVAACVLRTGAMHPHFLIVTMSAQRMMMSPGCSQERALVPVDSTMSVGMLTIWKGSKTCVSFLYVRLVRVFDVLEQEVPLEQLSDIKAKSIVEWIANDRVRRSIVKHFRQFLMTYVDDHGASVYGQRIRNLGESASFHILREIVWTDRSHRACRQL